MAFFINANRYFFDCSFVETIIIYKWGLCLTYHYVRSKPTINILDTKQLIKYSLGIVKSLFLFGLYYKPIYICSKYNKVGATLHIFLSYSLYYKPL